MASQLPLLLDPVVLLAVAFLFGVVVGSFANVCIYRIPLHLSVVSPRSRCPRCERPIRALENIPVLSWVFLLGRCRGCREPISLRYPLVELANGLLWAGVLFAFGPTVRAACLLPFTTALLILALVDYDVQILPDVITRPGIVLGLALAFVPAWPVRPVAALAAAAGGYAAFWGVAFAYRKTRGVDGLGQGDWKLAAMLGAWLGGQMLLFIVFAASVAGTVVGLVAARREQERLKYRLAFGTFLALAALLALFVGSPVIAWYRGLLRG